MKTHKEIEDRIIDAIDHFDTRLRKIGIQHTSTKAFGDIVAHYSKAVIDSEFADSKIAMLDGVAKLIKEIAGLEN